MYKEIGRKITSLTLLSILLASGVTFAVPGAMPVAEASHNANLYVSAESSQFSNYFAGPQVIEVIVNDNDIKTLDDAHGEPDVTINGKKLRMAQATDGNWYGYFADRLKATTADEAATNATSGGFGLDFGNFCDETTVFPGIGLFSQTVGFSVARALSDTEGGTNGTAAFTACTDVPVAADGLLTHVIRENKTLNQATGSAGQIGINVASWPVIQLYEFSLGGNVIVKYNKGGGTQTTTLTFDTIPSNLITHTMDRSTYPQSAQVHVTMTDPQLNIDPTDEDSWTWGTLGTNNTIVYQLFDENGETDADGPAAVDLFGDLASFDFEKNGKLTVNLGAQGTVVAEFNDNDNEATDTPDGSTEGGSIAGDDQPMTFTELIANAGTFGNYDESDNADLDILADAARGKSATIRYNDVSKSVVVGFGFGSVDINAPDGEWNSGEEIPVTLVDSDANKNSRADEDLDVNSAAVALIPTLKIGTPFTLETGDIAQFVAPVPTEIFVVGPGEGLGTLSGLTATANFTALNTTSVAPATTAGEVQTFSQRAILEANTTATVGGLIISFGERTAADLFESINEPSVAVGGFSGLNMLNYDIRGINGTFATLQIWLLNSTEEILTDDSATDVTVTAISLANVTSSQGLVNINGSDTDPDVDAAEGLVITGNIFDMDDTDNIGLLFIFNATDIVAGDEYPITADFFSFGINGDGFKQADRINNAIYRLELEETGDNTSTFIGTAEYTMLNQLNVFDNPVYEGLRTTDDEVTFIVHDDSDDEDSPRINYADLGQDGGVTFISDQQAAPTHSGVVSFDKDTYKLGDTVTISLEDADLNVDSDLIDIYVTAAPDFDDTAADTVGELGLGTYSDGSSFGRLLDITFDDLRWVNGTTNTGDLCADEDEQPAVPGEDGLDEAGFSLIETGTATGVFNGDFLLPGDYCDTNDGERKVVTGVDIEVNYVDFRDASGQLIEVGDGAGVRASTGSVSFDRTVYPVPFGDIDNFGETTGDSTSGGFSVFPVHLTGIVGDVDDDIDPTPGVIAGDETIGDGDLTLIIRVTDPDFDISFAGEDVIAQNTTGDDPVGPVKITVSRGPDEVVLAYAGGPEALDGTIDVGDDTPTATRQLGPMTEIAPDAGIFETELLVLYTDGPADSSCPETAVDGFDAPDGTPGAAEGDRFSITPDPDGDSYCILQGDIITVEYTDPTDASGDVNTVTDSATFDLRNGVLQS
ncbi:MAG: hypothetical protein WD033_03835, partial [Nitrosopumilaceae archaeon]